MDYGDGSGSYAPGSSKDNLRSFSLYGIWTAGSGAYTNVTARVGNFSTDLESYGDYPDKASYKQHAYSLSVEYGKRFDFEAGFFVEPQAQFTLQAGRYRLHHRQRRHWPYRRHEQRHRPYGFVMGQKIENGSDIYLKADLLHEFAGERNRSDLGCRWNQ
ncbi:MAG: autotransporter domain-containing protein [Phascolarctobacterium faecium]